MSNSSSYNNVLLKSPVQVQPAAVPKRDYQDEYSSADFQQTFNDLRLNHQQLLNHQQSKDRRDSARASDERTATSAANQKATTAENRKQANEISAQKKSAVDSARVDKNHINDEAATSKANARDHNAANNHGTDHQNSRNNVSDAKDASQNVCTKERKNSDDASDDSSLKNIDAPAPVPENTAVPVELNIALITATNAQSSSTGSESINTDALAIVVTDTSSECEDLIASAQRATEQTSVDGGQASTSDVDLQQILALQAVADSTALQASTAVVANEVAQGLAASGVAGQMGAVVSATQVKSTQVTSAGETLEQISDALTSATAGALNSEQSKATTAGTSATKESDISAALAQVLEPKSTFEKMLQTVARPDSAAQGDSMLLSNPGSSTNSTTNNVLDSLARFSDVQTPAARSFVVQTAVPVPVGQPQWSQAVGEKVLWLAAQNVTSAEINLHPKDLGPIQVKVSVNQEQATVSFTSHHAVVREVLDQNLNRLRDMFTEQGLNLVNVDVSDKSFSRQQGEEGKEQKGQGAANNLGDDETPVAVSAIVQQRLVDHYA